MEDDGGSQQGSVVVELCQLGDVGRELSVSSMGAFGHALDGIDGENIFGGGAGSGFMSAYRVASSSVVIQSRQ